MWIQTHLAHNNYRHRIHCRRPRHDASTLRIFIIVINQLRAEFAIKGKYIKPQHATVRDLGMKTFLGKSYSYSYTVSFRCLPSNSSRTISLVIERNPVLDSIIFFAGTKDFPSESKYTVSPWTT